MKAHMDVGAMATTNLLYIYKSTNLNNFVL